MILLHGHDACIETGVEGHLLIDVVTGQMCTR